MKQLFTLVIVIAILALPIAVNAGVAGSQHDLTTGYTLPTGGDIGAIGDLNVCTSCHLPHGSEGTGNKLWAQAVGGSGGIGGLCESCHDGTVAAAEITTGSLPFVTGGAASKHANAVDYASCSGVASACHDVHEENGTVAGSGQFMRLNSTDDAVICADCHDGANFAGSATLADMAGVVNHASVGTGCDCHVQPIVHGSGATAIDTKLLPVATANEACVLCHETGTGAYANIVTAGYTPGLFAFTNDATDQTQGKHLTTGAGLAAHTQSMTGCMDCHYLHGNATGDDLAHEKNQIVDNEDSGSCETCHDGSTAPAFGTNSHPAGTGFTITPAVQTIMTAAGYPNSQGDSDVGGTDIYGSAGEYIICESCHSVHRSGTSNTPFLRDTNVNDAFCVTCHTAN